MQLKPNEVPVLVQKRDSELTKARILEAAKVRFTRVSYEHVGTRDIAKDAGIDAAMVHRYFGSKEKLFDKVIEGAFNLNRWLNDDVRDLGEHFSGQFINGIDDKSWEDGFDPLQLLLRSSVSPVASEAVARRYHEEFVIPLAKKIGGEDAIPRAGAIASFIVGSAAMRLALRSPAFDTKYNSTIQNLLATAIRACQTPSPRRDET